MPVRIGAQLGISGPYSASIVFEMDPIITFGHANLPDIFRIAVIVKSKRFVPRRLIQDDGTAGGTAAFRVEPFHF